MAEASSDPLAPPPTETLLELGNATQVYRLLLDDGGGITNSKKEEATTTNAANTNTLDRQNDAARDSGSTTSDNNTSVWILLGAVSNLCSATLGAGVLSLPFALAQAGLVTGTLLLAAAAVATSSSVSILTAACQHYQKYTYESLAKSVLGLSVVVEVSMILFCGGCAVAYCIAVADILQSTSLLFWRNSRALTLCAVWSVTMLPLCLLRSMRSLEWASSVGIASIATLVLAAFGHWMEDYSSPHHHHHDGSSNSTNVTTAAELDGGVLANEFGLYYNDHYYKSPSLSSVMQVLLERFSQSAGDDEQTVAQTKAWESIIWPANGALSVLTAFPIILFAFSCQVNICAIYHELPPTTTLSIESSSNKLAFMQRITTVALAICAALYLSISVICLADFGTAAVQTNILNNYPHPAGIMQVACGAMAAAVIVAFPMNVFPARITLLHVLEEYETHMLRRRRRQQRPNETLTAALLEDVPAMDTTEQQQQDGELREQQRAENGPAIDNNAVQPRNDIAGRATGGDLLVELPDANVPFASPPNSNDDQDDIFIMPPCSWQLHGFLTLLLAGSALGLALVVPDIATIFGLLGGTPSSILGFCVPGALGIQLCRDKPDQGMGTLIVSWCLLVGGVLVGIVTTLVTIYTAAVGNHHDR